MRNLFRAQLDRLSVFALFAIVTCMTLSSISGCQAFAPAQTTQEKIAYAYGVHTAVVNATAQALNSKSIKSSDAEHVLSSARDARTFIDAASTAFAAGDTKTAEGQVALATSILTQLQSYLSSTQ